MNRTVSLKSGKPLKPCPKKSAAFRQEMDEGMRIANQLPKMMGAMECAKLLGISPQALRVAECRALYKVAQRLKAMLAGGAA